jgi:hypothetical protein
MRAAKFNTAVWCLVCLFGAGNFAIGLLFGGSFRAFWTGFSVGLLLVNFTVLKWAVTGLLWRKAQDDLAREEALITESFYAMVIEEYKSK